MDEGESPTPAGFAKADHFVRAEARNENRAIAIASLLQCRGKFASPFRLGQLGFDDMDRAEPRREKVGTRPSAPSPNLQPFLSREQLRARIENGRFVLVDEADLRMTGVKVTGVADFFPKIRPSRRALVAG